MSHRCQFAIGGHGSPETGPHYDYCEAPASIKYQGVWLCAEHYDFIENNAVNYIAQDPFWIPIKID